MPLFPGPYFVRTQRLTLFSLSTLLLLLLVMSTDRTSALTLAMTTSAASTSATKNGFRHPLHPHTPPPILSNVPGTWAHDTMSRRVDEEILARCAEDNMDCTDFDSDALQDLREEIRRNATLQPLQSPNDMNHQEWNKDYAEWQEILAPFMEKTWLSAPWLITEFYLYRRVMDCCRYWETSHDPFAAQKQAGLVSSVSTAAPLIDRMVGSGGGSDDETRIRLAVSVALWGNKMDLSLWPATDDSQQATSYFDQILSSAAENLLHDDTSIIVEHCQKLRAAGGGHVAMIVDNAGFELVTDLLLATVLCETGVARHVSWHVKSHPTFVSDATVTDVRATIAHYCANMETAVAGQAWQKFVDDGTWSIGPDSFWVQPLPFWEMREKMYNDFGRTVDWAIVKGDANYRRLLGDLEWSLTSDSFDKVVGSYFPCPVTALRTLKAEIGCGMKGSLVERARQTDNWMTNGQFGVVQFAKGGKKWRT